MSKAFKYPNTPIGFQGGPQDFTGIYNKGLYTTETTQRHTFGTRMITWDGRVFKYAHATAECQSGYGAANYALCNISAVLAANAAEGDTSVKVTVTSGGYAASGVIAEDELAGGYLILNNGVEDPQNFGIIGNDASVSATTCIVHLDAPLWQAVTTSGYCEVLDNPYAHLYGGITIGSNGFVSFVGIPCRNLVATYNGWIQTWGPCWVTPPSSGSGAPGYSAGDRECFFLAQGNGSIISGTGATVETGNQHCGFVMNRSETTAGGPPLVMLQISI
jgi:hypothetical protein